MISIRKYEETDWKEVKKLAVYDDQVKYVGTIKDLFGNRLDSWNFQLIEANEEIVGFFNIDTGYASQYEFAYENEIGLRAFFISSEHQGNGYCTGTMKKLPEYLKENYQEYPSICLTVNSKNRAAYQCYLEGGFQDTGDLYYGGSAGPQHIMRMAY